MTTPLHLAIGAFDGVHLGHRAVLRSARAAARADGGLVGVLTYEPHPSKVLRPETLRSYEAVWEQLFGQHIRWSSSAYLTRLNHLIVQDLDPGDGRFVYLNSDGADLRGADAEIEARWESGVRSRLSYAFAEAADPKTGEALANAPRHLARVNATIPLYGSKLYLGAEALGASGVWTGQRNRIAGSAIFNLTLYGRKLTKNLDASISVYNVFDKARSHPASPDFTQDANPLDGRTF